MDDSTYAPSQGHVAWHEDCELYLADDRERLYQAPADLDLDETGVRPGYLLADGYERVRGTLTYLAEDMDNAEVAAFLLTYTEPEPTGPQGLVLAHARSVEQLERYLGFGARLRQAHHQEGHESLFLVRIPREHAEWLALRLASGLHSDGRWYADEEAAYDRFQERIDQGLVRFDG